MAKGKSRLKGQSPCGQGLSEEPEARHPPLVTDADVVHGPGGNQGSKDLCPEARPACVF